MDNTDLALMVGRFEAKQDQMIELQKQLNRRHEEQLENHSRRLRSLENRRRWWQTTWAVTGGALTLAAGWLFSGGHK